MLRYGKWLRTHEEDLDRVEGWFDRHGDLAVLGARVVPGARSVVSIPAGTSRMPLLRFTFLTTIGPAVWNAVLIGAGYVLGANWSTVQNWVGYYSDAVLAAAVVVVAVYLLYRGLESEKRRISRATARAYHLSDSLICSWSKRSLDSYIPTVWKAHQATTRREGHRRAPAAHEIRSGPR